MEHLKLNFAAPNKFANVAMHATTSPEGLEVSIFADNDEHARLFARVVSDMLTMFAESPAPKATPILVAHRPPIKTL